VFEHRNEPTVEPMLLTARQTAKALSICEKTLWTLTQQGEIPCVRIGRAVRYDPADLQNWIQRAKNLREAS